MFDGSLSNLAEERCQFSPPVLKPVDEFAGALFSTDKHLFALHLYHLLSHDKTRGIISQTQVIIIYLNTYLGWCAPRTF